MNRKRGSGLALGAPSVRAIYDVYYAKRRAQQKLLRTPSPSELDKIGRCRLFMVAILQNVNCAIRLANRRAAIAIVAFGAWEILSTTYRTYCRSIDGLGSRSWRCSIAFMTTPVVELRADSLRIRSDSADHRADPGNRIRSNATVLDSSCPASGTSSNLLKL